MGIKGDKLNQDATQAAELITEKLGGIPGISAKKMFGGYGIFHDKKMFGIVDSKGQCFFKVNELNKSDFEQKGSSQHSKMPYFSIPEVVLNDQNELIAWAKKAIEFNK